MKVAIVGAGLIGRAWAIVFARGGSSVELYDQNQSQCEAATMWIDQSLIAMHEHGLIAEPQTIRARISIAASLDQALAGASHVQESVVERVETKQELFAEIEKHATADAILTSSSSAIMPSVIFGKLKSRHRCLVAHPMNPPHLAPIVELCGADFTSQSALQRANELMTTCGMSVVVLQKEIEGFILNRLQHALLNEAFRLIEDGYVSPHDLDKTLKDGLALRWSFMGPIETIDLNAPGGVRDYMNRYGEMVARIGMSQAESRPWSDLATSAMETSCRKGLSIADISAAQVWRDQRLMALARHKKEVETKE